MENSRPNTMAELVAAQLWQIPLRVSFDALADLYYGFDGPWVDELLGASLKELEFHNTISGVRMRSEVQQFFDTYRRHLRGR